MKKEYFFILLLFFTVVFVMDVEPSAKNVSKKESKKTREKLNTLMRQFQKADMVPGFALGILKNNEIFYAEGFGVTNLDKPKPVTPRSLFHMASVSKPFVATAVMQLVEQGKMNLDGKLVDYLPYFKMEDERYKEITIRQMLDHTSGLPDVEDYEWDKPQYDDGAAERYIRSLVKEKLVAAPGQMTYYSNMAFDILADVIARVSGVSFEEYMAENLFKPLEMKDSTFLKKEVSPALATSPHVEADTLEGKISVSEIYPYNRAHAPSSTLHSNVLDMCNWAAANINKGSFKGKRILRESAYDILWRPHAYLSRPRFSSDIGLSWFLEEYKGHKMVSHGGGDTGYRTFFLMLPAESLAVVTMGNFDNFHSRQVANAALDIMLGLEPGKPKQGISTPVGRAIAKDGVDAAIKLFAHLKEKHADVYEVSEDSLIYLGDVLVNKNRFADAVVLLEYNQVLFPGSWRNRGFLGNAYMKKGDMKRAVENYREAVASNPKSNPYEIRVFNEQSETLKKLESQRE